MWVNLEDVMLIEVSYPPKDKYSVMPFIEDTQCGQVIDAESAVVAVICGENEQVLQGEKSFEFWGLIV